jgi:hypothetical protein
VIRDVYVDNVLRERWNDDANPRVVTFFDAAGAQTSQRNYTAFEIAAVDALAATTLSKSNEATIRQLLNDTLPTLQTITDTTNANMSGNTAAAAIKDLARANRRIIRLLTNNLSGTN